MPHVIVMVQELAIRLLFITVVVRLLIGPELCYSQNMA
jgi:hypothetical protein